MPYQPPLERINTALDVVGLDDVLSLPDFGDFARDDVRDVLAGFGTFAADVIAPTNRIGDLEGATLDPNSGRVTVSEEVAKAFSRWVADGWSGLAQPPRWGGGGFPRVVGLVAEEMLASANMALSLNPMLTQGAIHLLTQCGSEDQQATFLPNLISGRWTGTMCLTEPDAGSDVGAVRAKATPRPDGRWEITGTKIFITWGEHDLAENIIHAVLARTPGSPPGTKGLSLFIVPRNHVNPDSSVGERNSLRCTGLEHKLGIHSSPTCVLDFDEAVGDLIGPEHGGMAAMFTMMNAARLSVGIEGLAIGERAYQHALAYARERRQGRTATTPVGESALIIEHPDVRRMLALMASSLDAMRLLLYATAAATDMAHHHPDSHRRAEAQARVDLLTPLAKAWPTDEGVRLASLAVQVYGGMGFIEEAGVAQLYRDSRIAPIYEGTNGIQAIDLIGRKVRRDGGRALRSLVDQLADEVTRLGEIGQHTELPDLTDRALQAVRETTDWILNAEDDDWLAAATPFLELCSLAVTGGLLARALVQTQGQTGREVAALAGRARFFATERIATAPSLLASIRAGASRLDVTNLT